MSDGSHLLRRELRGVVSLAVPVVTVQMGLMLMGVVDTMILGRLSEAALAAGGLGNAVGMGVLVVPMALLLVLDPLVGQAWGARDPARMGRHVRRAVVMAVALTVPSSLVMMWLGSHLGLLRQPPELQHLAGDYLRYLVPGNLAFLLFGVWRQTLQARGVVWPAVVAIGVANLFNVVADYALVFGRLGFPPLGVRGSAIATSASRWMVFLMLLVFSWPLVLPLLRRGWHEVLAFAPYLQMLRIGVPIAVQMGLEFYVFMTVALMMGNLGSREMAAHQIAINLASLSFMVPLGIAGAGATRVGNAIGRGDAVAARRSSGVVLVLGAAVMLIFAFLFAAFPEKLARLYTSESAVVALAATLIPIAALFQVFDGTQVVGAGVLRGAADTRFPAAIAFTGFWVVGLPIGWWLAFPQEMGPAGLWWGLTAGLAVVAGLLVWRILTHFRGELEAIAEI